MLGVVCLTFWRWVFGVVLAFGPLVFGCLRGAFGFRYLAFGVGLSALGFWRWFDVGLWRLVFGAGSLALCFGCLAFSFS